MRKRSKKHDRQSVMTFVRKNAGKLSSLDMSIELNVSKSFIVFCGVQLGISLEMDKTINEKKRVRDLIRENYSEKTVKEIAAMAGVPASRVWYTGQRLGLEIKRQLAKPKSKLSRNVKEGYFNAFDRKNWLV